MLNRLKSFLFKKEKVNLSTNEGSTTLTITPPDKHPTIRKIQNNESISYTDINLFLSDVLDKPAIKGNLFKLHEAVLKESIFLLETFHIREEADGTHTVTGSYVDVVHNLPIKIEVDLTRYSEVFEEFKINTPEFNVNEKRSHPKS